MPVGYERRDTVTSLTMLLGNVAVNLAAGGAVGKLSRLVFDRRIANIGKRRGSLAVAIVAWDFLYYWDHRWMHEVRLFWANHVSHHSGQRYNLSTALRQPWSGFLLSWVYLPMPLLGIPAHHVIRPASSTCSTSTGSTPRRSTGSRSRSRPCSTRRRTTGCTTAPTSSTSTATTAAC